jgi:NADH oxidoreductase Hcr
MNLAVSIWKGDTLLRCVEKRQETQDASTFVLAAPDSSRFDYRPGQFILIDVEIDGRPYQRAYSLCSTPSRPKTLEITIKRVKGGKVSNWVLDHLEEGEMMRVSRPTGKFFLPPNSPAKDFLLFSAGCGITPVMSMARWLVDTESKARIVFVHNAIDLDNVIFRAELEHIRKKKSAFDLELILEPTVEESARRTERFISEDMRVQDIAQAEAYLCGPRTYMDAVEGWLAGIGLSRTQIFREEFSSAPVASSSCLGAEGWTLTMTDFGKKLVVAKGQSLLEVMEKGDIPITGACRQGICGSCKCKVTGGKTESSSRETLTPDQIADGYVLACSTVALSDLNVRL